MKYSVLMSVYYKENPAFLQASIDSILAQTIQTDDFVIVCDGPLPIELMNVISKFKTSHPNIFNIIALSEHKGLSVALNIGLKACHNSIVARMDSDDISKPERIEYELEAMNKNSADIVGAEIEEFNTAPGDSVITRNPPETNDEIARFAKRRNPFNHPTVMFHKEAVITSGGYGCKFSLCEDYELWIRMLHNGYRGYNVQSILLYMRVGDGMYRRRGGIRYLITLLHFEVYLIKHRFINITDFVVACTAHTILCLVTPHCRKFLYKFFLRGNVKH
jgi:glycosyltransferase involved in cell wall biosynthesis